MIEAVMTVVNQHSSPTTFYPQRSDSSDGMQHLIGKVQMKNTLFKTPLVIGLTVLSSLVAGTVSAGEALDQVNAQVEETAAQIDAEHGVLLTTAERENLKLSIISEKVTTVEKGVQLDVVETTDAAIDTYQITDPTNQRKLLIEIESNLLGGAGAEPPQ